MGTIKTTNIETITGSGTLTLGQSGETISIPSGATLTVPSGGLTGQNYPAFEAYLSPAQTLTDTVRTKLQFNIEKFDTDSCYDNVTNYRFTPNVAGKYYVFGSIQFDTSGSVQGAIDVAEARFYVNGNPSTLTRTDFRTNPVRMAYASVEDIIEFNGTTDYVELYGALDINTNTPIVEPDTSWTGATRFGAYRIGA